MTAMPWFKAEPELLEREQKALTDVGVEYSIDSTALGQGILRLSLSIEGTNPAFDFEDKARAYELVAVFPDSYPYFRPEVYGHNIDLPRHQNVLNQGLCLIPRGTDAWEPQWTLAGFLQAQLPKVLRKGSVTDPAAIALDEDEQAEPVSDYYASHVAPVLIDDSQIAVNSSKDGKIHYLGKFRVGAPIGAALPTRLAVLEMLGDVGKGYQLPEIYSKIFPTVITGALYQLAVRPPTGTAEEDIKWLKQEYSSQGAQFVKPNTPIKLKDGVRLVSVTGVVFPEEVEPGVVGIGWLFIVEGEVQNKRNGPWLKGYYYARAARLSEQGVKLRVPQLLPLRSKKVAIVGLGALGAPSAIEFARNQVGSLSLLDYDAVEPATTVRWPLGLAAYGQPKEGVIDQFIQFNYPNTKVFPFHYRLGVVRMDDKSQTPGVTINERDVLDDFLEDASLLYDASAEPGINHFLSQEARGIGIPYILISATQGAYGGIVFRAIPGKTQGCWMCFQWAKHEGLIPIPPEDNSGSVHVHGCGDVTFTGAGYDLQNISLAGVRLAVSTLSAGESGSLAEFDWDVAILRLVDNNNNPVLPKWETYKLEIHPKCPYCATGS